MTESTQVTEKPIIFMGQSLVCASAYRLKPRPYIVKGLLLSSQVGLLAGPPNIGKSSVIASICAHVASGQQIGEQRVKRAAILYVAAEDAMGIAERIAAFWPSVSDANRGEVHIYPEAINLTDDVLMSAFIEDAKRFKEHTRETNLMVVFDTLNLCLGDGDENSAQDVSRAMGNAQRLARETGAHVMIAHHTSAADAAKPRGSTAMVGNADTVLVLRQIDDSKAKIVALTHEKQRSLRKGKPMPFELQSFELGCDEDGDELTVPFAAPLSAGQIDKDTASDFASVMTSSSRREAELKRALLRHEECEPGKYWAPKDLVAEVGEPFGELRENRDSLMKAVRRTLDGLVKSGVAVSNGKGGFAIVQSADRLAAH